MAAGSGSPTTFEFGRIFSYLIVFLSREVMWPTILLGKKKGLLRSRIGNVSSCIGVLGTLEADSVSAPIGRGCRFAESLVGCDIAVIFVWACCARNALGVLDQWTVVGRWKEDLVKSLRKRVCSVSFRSCGLLHSWRRHLHSHLFLLGTQSQELSGLKLGARLGVFAPSILQGHFWKYLEDVLCSPCIDTSFALLIPYSVPWQCLVHPSLPAISRSRTLPSSESWRRPCAKMVAVIIQYYNAFNCRDGFASSIEEQFPLVLDHSRTVG